MLDSDLAELYGVETKVFNQAVKRNASRFPSDFMFQLSKEESEFLRSQTVTLDAGGRGRHRKYLPYVFTEQGVAMLSGVLRDATIDPFRKEQVLKFANLTHSWQRCHKS
jgi:hypothetical protein